MPPSSNGWAHGSVIDLDADDPPAAPPAATSASRADHVEKRKAQKGAAEALEVGYSGLASDTQSRCFDVLEKRKSKSKHDHAGSSRSVPSEQSKRMKAAAVDRNESGGTRDEEQEEARFSDGEDERPTGRPLGDVGGEGFDFSGTVCADATQPVCLLCHEPLDASWSNERNELVVRDAVMLRHIIYHAQCVIRQRGQNADWGRKQSMQQSG